MEKVVTLQELKIIKQYKEFFKDKRNCDFALKCFFKSDCKFNKIS